jgi:hypothetical protein
MRWQDTVNRRVTSAIDDPIASTALGRFRPFLVRLFTVFSPFFTDFSVSYGHNISSNLAQVTNAVRENTSSTELIGTRMPRPCADQRFVTSRRAAEV